MSALGDYLQRVIREKGLSLLEIQRRSGGKISDSYVKDIMSGKTKRPGAQKLMALADAIGEDYKELSELASGKRKTEGWTANGLKNAMVKMVEDEKVGDAVRIIVSSTHKDVERVLKFLRRK